MILGVLALVGFILVWWVYRPGFMSRDSIVQLTEARSTHYSDWHPPILALIWHYLDRLWPGPIGMLLLFDGLYWFGVCVFFRRLRWPLWARAATLILVSFNPAVFMLLGTIWKDTLMQAAFLAGFAALLLTGSGLRRAWWAAALVLMFIGVAARHNAFVAAWPLLALPVFGHARLLRWHRLWQLAAGLGIGLVCALTLQQAALLLSRHIAEQTELWQVVSNFDLAGMSLQVNEVLIEPETGALSPGMKLDDIRRVYDPTDLLQLYKCRRRGCTPVFARTTDGVKLRALSANWKRAVLAHPRAYLAHRWLAFRGVLRIGERNPEISGGIARNSLGVPTVRSEAGIWVVNLLRALPRFPFYVTWLYALLDCVLLGVGLFDFFKRGNALCFCLSLSGLAYLGTYFLAAGTPDFRYSVWTILTTLLAACALAGLDRPAFGGVSSADRRASVAVRTSLPSSRRILRA